MLAEREILTVSRFTAILRDLLEENFQHVWLEGEVSNLSIPSSGHLYFTLKDPGAQIRCVMFRSSARNLRFRPADGLGLIVRGRLSLYEQRGECQLVVEYAEPRGVGALQLAFLQLRERLAKEGLFDESVKRPLPVLPQRIGVVTSSAGAAIHDILNVLNRRFANIHVLIRPVRVQGDGAALEIAEAIDDFSRLKEVDAVIVARGGGSMEDLWAFNEEVVARAIRRSAIPVITGVGHEVDFTIADFAADLRAPTPSAAAELVVRSKVELEGQLEGLLQRLVNGIRHTVVMERGELHRLVCMLKHPAMLVDRLSQRVDDLSGRLARAASTRIARKGDSTSAAIRRLQMVTPAVSVEKCRESLLSKYVILEREMRRIFDRGREAAAVASARLQALSPLATLARGYAVVRRLPDAQIIADAGKVSRGDRLELLLKKGRVVAVVESSRYED